MVINFLAKRFGTNTKDLQNNITLLANHLLVVYAYVSPMYARAVSSVIFIILILFLIRGNYKYYLQEAISNKIVQAFLIYIAVHLIWLIGTDDLANARHPLSLLKYFLYPMLILAFVDKGFISRIITAFIFGMLTSELISYLIHFDILPYKMVVLNTLIYESQDLNNPTPFLNHSFYNTLISIIVGILLYNLLANKNSIFTKIISIFFISTASINMVLIGGRAGYLAFIVVIFVTLFLVYKKNFFKVALPIAIVGLISFFYLAYHSSSMFEARINAIVKDKNKLFKDNANLNTSIGLRLGYWMYGWEVIKEKPIFGVGTGDEMDEVFSKVSKDHKYIKQLWHPHNEYVKSILQFGFIGFLSFLYILYVNFTNQAVKQDYKAVLIIVTVAFMVLMLTSDMSKQLWMVFILISSVASAKANFLEKNDLFIRSKEVFFYIIASITTILIALAQG